MGRLVCLFVFVGLMSYVPVAEVAAVPLIAFGSVLSISGAALEEVGDGALIAGSDLARIGSHGLPVTHGVAPNGPPTLD